MLAAVEMNVEMNENQSMTATAEFSERDLRSIFHRALVIVAICAAVGLPVVARLWGWRSMLLYLVGAVIAGTGVFEWRELTSAIFSRLEASGGGEPRPPRAIGRVLVWFFLRLLAAAVLLYASLKSLDGRPIALILGLALGMLALLIEALRLFRNWTA